MSPRRPQSIEPRVWARRDRTVVPTNRTRARIMRSDSTDAERKLLWHLRHRLQLSNSHFRRQFHLGRYIVDFVSHEQKLIIEIDGGEHARQIASDTMRTRFLESKGYRVLRFWNNDVLANVDGVLAVIQAAILSSFPSPLVGEGREGGAEAVLSEDGAKQPFSSAHSLTTPTPTPPHKGEGKETCASPPQAGGGERNRPSPSRGG